MAKETKVETKDSPAKIAFLAHIEKYKTSPKYESKKEALLAHLKTL